MTDHAESPDARPHARIGTSQASAARLYATYQQEKDGYRVDHRVADQISGLLGDTRLIASSNRGFIGRAVRVAAGELGLTQFLDLGAGVPQAPDTHTVARAVTPDARTLYVDNDLIVLRHFEALLDSGLEGATTCVEGDVRDTGTVLEAAARTLDLDRPTAVILGALLHFVTDEEDPRGIIERYLAPLPPGSCLIFSHGTDDFAPAAWRAVEEIYCEQGITTQIRGRAAISGLLDGLDLLPPGLVEVHRWRPEVSPLEASGSEAGSGGVEPAEAAEAASEAAPEATAAAPGEQHRHCYGAIGVKPGRGALR